MDHEKLQRMQNAVRIGMSAQCCLKQLNEASEQQQS